MSDNDSLTGGIRVKKAKRHCFVFTSRQGTILTGVLQSTIQLILSFIILLTWKIELQLREKQIADLIDHGVDFEQIENGEHLPDTLDVHRLWAAKQRYDVIIGTNKYFLIASSLYALACVLTVYGAIVRSQRLVLAMNIYLMAFFATISLTIIASFAYYGHWRKWPIFYSICDDFSTDDVYIHMFTIPYFLFGSWGTYVSLCYYIELRGRVRCEDGSPSCKRNIFLYSKGFVQNLWPKETLKTMLHSAKDTYTKYQNTKPTAV